MDLCLKRLKMHKKIKKLKKKNEDEPLINNEIISNTVISKIATKNN
jgi:hypothetical protein